MKRPVRVLFVADGPAAGGATAAAIGADPAIEVLARCADPVEAADLIAALEPDVALLYASAADPQGRAALERAAAQYGLPLLVREGGILWVCGQRVDERARVRNLTERVLALRFVRTS